MRHLGQYTPVDTTVAVGQESRHTQAVADAPNTKKLCEPSRLTDGNHPVTATVQQKYRQVERQRLDRRHVIAPGAIQSCLDEPACCDPSIGVLQKME